MKHLKLFEQFIEERIDLNKGERAAKTRGQDILNMGQAAVSYVLALDNLVGGHRGSEQAKEIEKKYGNINNLMSEVFGTAWKNMDFGKWKTDILVDRINMEKIGSLNYATEKMKKMLNGDFSNTGNQVIYEKIKNFFLTLSNKTKEELVDFIDDFMKDPKAEKHQAGYVPD